MCFLSISPAGIEEVAPLEHMLIHPLPLAGSYSRSTFERSLPSFLVSDRSSYCCYFAAVT